MTVRHNTCPNPALGANDTGWSTGGGFTRATGATGLPRSTVYRLVAPGGSGYVQTPTASASPGQQWTLSAYIKNYSGFPTTRDLYCAFTRSAGGTDFSQVGSTGALANGTVTQVSVSGTAPANTTGVYLIIDTLNPGVDAGVSGIDVTAVLYEQVASLDTYFDGDSADSSWDGTAQNSASTFDDSATTTPVDSDLDIRYRVRNQVSSDLDLRYRVSNAVTSDLDIRYRVRNQVSSDLDLRYRVGAIINSDLTIKYRCGDFDTDGYDIPEILDALAAVYDGLEIGDEIGGVAVTLQAKGMVPGQVSTPALVLEVDSLTWDLSMGGGADSFDVSATLLWQDESSEDAQRSLLSFLSKRATAGAGRMKAALEADQTLGGLVSYAVLTRVRDIGTQTYNGLDYLGAQLVIEVMS